MENWKKYKTIIIYNVYDFEYLFKKRLMSDLRLFVIWRMLLWHENPDSYKELTDEV